MTYIAVFPAQSRFIVKLICCIAFVSAPSACCLLKSTAIILSQFLKELQSSKQLVV